MEHGLRNAPMKDDTLIEIVYLSEREDTQTDRDVVEILRSSNDHNRQAGITGLLVYDGECFLQVLEGPRAEVSSLYADILGDDRHHNIITIHEGPIVRRVYKGWGMAYKRIDPASDIIRLARRQLAEGRATEPSILHVGAYIKESLGVDNVFTWSAKARDGDTRPRLGYG